MKSIFYSALTVGGLVLPAYAHDHPIPHSHDAANWGLALIGLVAGAFGTWATMKCVSHFKENRDG
ncbi:MAG: hypothetical protein AAFQ15_12055 [Pseudomonadota bacterium]